jgi:LCP family protein required for cell wall assembly
VGRRLGSRAIAAVVGVALVAAVLYLAVDLGRAVTAVSSDPLGIMQNAPAPSADGGGHGTAILGTDVAAMLARGERVNLLLLGYGGAGHDGAYLTDGLMVASLEPATHVVTLLSIPRDLWVTIPRSAWQPAHLGKINEPFAIAADHGDRDSGIRLAVNTLEPVLGIHIDRAVAVDFRAFRTVVDAIGGVDVSVDRSFVAAYPKNDDPDVDDSWITISFKAGPQHMDGETALRFARARYADPPEGTDFARSARQQKIILAARKKVEQSGSVPTLFGLLDALRDNVRTDLSLADMRALADFARNYDDSATVRAALTDQNALKYVSVPTSAGDLYTLQPRTTDWSAVQLYVGQLLTDQSRP